VDNATQDVSAGTEDATTATEEATQDATAAVDNATQDVAAATEDATTATDEATQDATAAVDNATQDVVPETAERLDAQIVSASEGMVSTLDSALTTSEALVTDVSATTEAATTELTSDIVDTVETLGTADAVLLAQGDLNAQIVSASEGMVSNLDSALTSSEALVTDVSAMVASAAALDEAGSSSRWIASLRGSPEMAEVLAVPYSRHLASTLACGYACGQRSAGVLGVFGDKDSFTDSVLSTIRSLAMTGLNVLLRMWSILLFAVVGVALVTRGRRPTDGLLHPVRS
jgi:hypothetical protein